MGYEQHWLLAFGGHAGELTEEWNCNIRLALYGFDIEDSVNEESYLDDQAMPTLAAWFARANSYIASVAQLQWVKFNEIDELGHYADGTQVHERTWPGTGISGGSTGTLHPLQVCMCLSWRTNAAERGIGSHGRIYSPRPTLAIDPDGDVNAAGRDAAAVSAATMLNGLDVAIGTAVLRPSICSPGRGWPGVKTNPGVNNQIDYVLVDSVFDIQRRRAKGQTREYSPPAVVAY